MRPHVHNNVNSLEFERRRQHSGNSWKISAARIFPAKRTSPLFAKLCKCLAGNSIVFIPPDTRRALTRFVALAKSKSYLSLVEIATTMVEKGKGSERKSDKIEEKASGKKRVAIERVRAW